MKTSREVFIKLISKYADIHDNAEMYISEYNSLKNPGVGFLTRLTGFGTGGCTLCKSSIDKDGFIDCSLCYWHHMENLDGSPCVWLESYTDLAYLNSPSSSPFIFTVRELQEALRNRIIDMLKVICKAENKLFPTGDLSLSELLVLITK